MRLLVAKFLKVEVTNFEGSRKHFGNNSATSIPNLIKIYLTVQKIQHHFQKTKIKLFGTILKRPNYVIYSLRY